MKQSTTYTFKYETESDSIDINTLLLSQIHFSAVLNEIKNEIAPDAKLSIKIKPLSKGSVPFDIILDISWLESLLHLADTAIDHADKLIAVLLGLIELRRQLKGKKPIKVVMKKDTVEITTEDAIFEIRKEAYKIHENNAVVDQSLKKGFEAIEKDQDVDGIKILNPQRQTLIEIPREDFADITEPNEIFEEQKIVEPVRKEVLTVFKVVFDKGYKWQFYLNGRKITAKMSDDGFMEHLKTSKERFGYGDTMEVELEVEKVFDKNLNIFIERDFNITKVLSHTPQPKQGDIFNNDKEA